MDKILSPFTKKPKILKILFPPEHPPQAKHPKKPLNDSTFDLL
uniref:Uncharacterized protein n=1 Tax=Nelumbo nucifera TaxID=4432 RepID=A0A822YUJ0_NELNU|nr:TPA_asm: hypothetical protein HUJ06_005719 [Nelumbo nucifera]